MALYFCFRGIARFRRLLPVCALGLLGLSAYAQSPICNIGSSSIPFVAASGLAEKIGNPQFTCTGGTPGATVSAFVYVGLNANITNPLDVNGNPLNITVTSTGAAVTATPAVFSGPTTLEFTSVSYTVPNPSQIPVVIQIGGIRAAVASIQNAASPTSVTATLLAIGSFSLSGGGTPFTVAFGVTSLLSSTLNDGVFCSGSPLPPTTDFPTFISNGNLSSAVRVTESFAGAFAPADATSTNGTRIFVRFSGYGPGVSLYVPNALVGNSGTVATSAGEFSTPINSGTYTPLSNQLFLSLVSGADQNGAGGSLVTPIPAGTTTFTAMTPLTVSSTGSAYAVYEVLDHNPNMQESVQVPVFVVNPPSTCGGTTVPAAITTVEAPVSNVSVATSTDPVPRYISAPLGDDCQLIGDCTAAYFPVLSVNTTALSFTGASQGATQNATINVLNNGGSVLSYTVSVAYPTGQSGTNWLTVTPSSSDIAGMGGVNLAVAANPTALQPGTYTATVTVNGGEAGTASVPLTFTVGQASTISLNTTQISFSGSSLGNAQNISVLLSNNSGSAVSFSVSTAYQSGANWLTVTPLSGSLTTSTTLALMASPAALQPGTYSATITINAGASGTLSLPVTFTVGLAIVTFTTNPTQISLSGSSLGAAQNASIALSVQNNGGTPVSFGVSITSGATWLTVTPSSGSVTTSTNLTVTASPAALQPGTYSATITVSGGAGVTASIPVTFTVGAPGVTIQGIVNAASFQTGAIAPGSYVALFGLNLAGANVSVTFNGSAAQVIYDSAGQINLIVPNSLSGQATASVVATVNGAASNSFNVTLAPNVPAIFTPGILNADSSVNSASNPATRGLFVQVYLTGLATPVVAGSATVNIGSQTVVPLFAGPTILPALDQVNVTVPASLAFAGNSTQLAVCVTPTTAPSAPICSNSVTLYVQ